MGKWTQRAEMTEFSPPPRSCEVQKWPTFAGYGFTLHNNKELGAQTIGGVDEKSPAAAAGLKKGDIIIEINGVNITRENHAQIVARIKASGDCTLFLVADRECKDYHDREGIIITCSMPNVIYLSSKRPQMSSSHHQSESEDSDGQVEVPEKKVSAPPPLVETSSSSSSSYSSEEEEEEEEAPKVVVPPPVPAQEAKPTLQTAITEETSSSSSEEEEEVEEKKVVPPLVHHPKQD